jgi:hypothetical protein
MVFATSGAHGMRRHVHFEPEEAAAATLVVVKDSESFMPPLLPHQQQQQRGEDYEDYNTIESLKTLAECGRALGVRQQHFQTSVFPDFLEHIALPEMPVVRKYHMLEGLKVMLHDQSAAVYRLCGHLEFYGNPSPGRGKKPVTKRLRMDVGGIDWRLRNVLNGHCGVSMAVRVLMSRLDTEPPPLSKKDVLTMDKRVQAAYVRNWKAQMEHALELLLENEFDADEMSHFGIYYDRTEEGGGSEMVFDLEHTAMQLRVSQSVLFAPDFIAEQVAELENAFDAWSEQQTWLRERLRRKLVRDALAFLASNRQPHTEAPLDRAAWLYQMVSLLGYRVDGMHDDDALLWEHIQRWIEAVGSHHVPITAKELALVLTFVAEGPVNGDSRALRRELGDDLMAYYKQLPEVRAEAVRLARELRDYDVYTADPLEVNMEDYNVDRYRVPDEMAAQLDEIRRARAQHQEKEKEEMLPSRKRVKHEEL